MNNPFEVIEARLRSIENLILDLKHKLDLKHEPTDQPEQLLTIQQAAEFLSLKVPTMYSKVSKGELPVMKRSKRLYFSRTELLEYLKDGRKKSNAEITVEPTDQPEQLLTIQQAAELAGLTVSTMHSKVSKGELRVIERSMQLLYFSRTELLEYLKAIEQEAEALEYLKDGRKKSNVEIEAEAYLSNNKKALK